MELLFSSLWLAIVTWLIVRATKQRGLLPRLDRVLPPSENDVPRIAVIVPARDEEANIGRCVETVVAQDYPAGCLDVLVVDDQSSDATAAVVRRLAARHRNVALIQSPSLPPRWVGKSHACWIGARSVAPETDWLCFIDADVRLKSGALSSAIYAAQTRNLDLLSLAPRQQLKSFAERLILPCGLVILSFLQDLRQIQARSSSDVTATGQFMLVRRDVYEDAGGHAAVCTAICEDLEFARRLKRAGRSVLLMGGDELLSVRMYTGWRTLWPGLAKNLVDMLGGPATTVTLAFGAIVLAWATYLLPVLDLAGWWQGADGSASALILALAGSGAAIGLHIAAMVHFRVPFWYGLLFPLGYTVGALLALDSVRRRLSGRMSWRGRIYS